MENQKLKFTKYLTVEECLEVLEDLPDDDNVITDLEESDNEDSTLFDDVFQTELEHQEHDVHIHSHPSSPASVDTQDEVVACSSSSSTSSTSCINSGTSINRKWRKKEMTTRIPDYNLNEGVKEQSVTTSETGSDIFLSVVDPILENIIFQSNLYAVQRGKLLNMKRHEFLCFLGINFFMGYHTLPSWKHYWSTSNDLGIPIVRITMSRDRFDAILSNLHVNDNSKIPKDNSDKLYKIRPMITELNEHFDRLYYGTRELSVDESMILFKGRSSIKQYNPMKPIKRGYKLWCLADQKGYILNFDVYQGKNSTLEKEYENYGLGERVVLGLTKQFWGQNRKIYFDNFFTSLPLLERLKVENTLACGTIRANRKGFPQNLTQSKDMKRGEFDYRISSMGIGVFQWKDSKPVCFASNFHGTETTTVSRKQKDGSSIDVSCPIVVDDYNRHMGGVDHADRLRMVYGLNRCSKKWWHRLFWGMLEIAFVNAYVIYCHENGKSSLLEYRRQVSLGLMNQRALQTNKSPRGCKTKTTPDMNPAKRKKCEYSVPKDVRLGNRGNHFVKFVGNRGRCEVCAKKHIQSRPHSKCTACNVFLCCNEKKNCFAVYHDVSVE